MSSSVGGIKVMPRSVESTGINKYGLLANIRVDALAIAIVALVSVLIFPDTTESKVALGIEVFGIPLYYCIVMRRWRRCAIILMLVTLINFNVFFSVCLNPEIYLGSSQWQANIYDTVESCITLKALVLFTAFFLLGLSSSLDREKSLKPLAVNIGAWTSNVFKVIASAIILYALVFGTDRGTIGTYTSNSNPIYEYAIVFFVLLWGSTKSGDLFRKVLIIYAILYMGQGLLFGDRSSAFPMAIVLYLLISKRQITVLPLLAIGMAGIMLSNCIDLFRNSGWVDISEVLSRGLYSNTVSSSFYGGTTITMFSEMVGERFEYFANFLLSIFVGSMGELTDLALAASAHSSTLFNRGGGFTSSYLYFWFGYPGSVIGSLVMGMIVGKIASRDSSICSMLCILLICFAIRWYVYFPIAFFRTALFVPIVVYFVFRVFVNTNDKTHRKRDDENIRVQIAHE